MRAPARIAAVLLAAAAVAVPAGAAVAQQQQPVHAQTKITNRPDSGNGGTWAYDGTRAGPMVRTITIRLTGGSAGAYTFTATLKDKGTFTTIKGAKTPNQGGTWAGDTIASKVTGKLSGYDTFSFTASSLPSGGPNAGFPVTENDHKLAPSDSTSTWYKFAFPSATTFSSTTEGPWSWTYKATVVTVTSQRLCVARGFCWTVPVVSVSRQQWIDAWNNGDGDQQADGNISG